MHQSGVVALAQEVEQVASGIDVGGERVAQVRIEIRQAGAVGDHVERTLQARLRCDPSRPRPGWLTSPSTTSTFFAEERGEIRSVGFPAGDRAWEIPRRFFSKRRCAEVVRLRRINSVIFAMLGIFFEQVHQPDLADEAGDADKQEVLAGK